VHSSLSDNQEYLILDRVGEFDVTELEGAHPTCHFVVAHRVKNFLKFLYLFRRIFIRTTGAEAVEFLILIIFHVFAYGCQEAVFLTRLVLAATFFGLIFNGLNGCLCGASDFRGISRIVRAQKASGDGYEYEDAKKNIEVNHFLGYEVGRL
jgi:hypothetical protein